MVSNINRKSKIFEFLTLLSSVVGIVLGTGEFIKNDNKPGHVLFYTHNPILALIIWSIIGISAILMLFCFIELIASSTSPNSSLSCLVSKFISRKLGSYVSLFFIFIYYPIIYTYFSMMLVYWLTLVTNWTIQPIMYLFLSIVFILFFGLLNSFTRKPGKYYQIIGTFFKLIPLFLVLILGFFFHNSDNTFVDPDLKKWNFESFFLATGPILFSFDGFIFAANLQKETKNKSLVYKALISGMIIVVIAYLLETLALFLGTKDGSVLTLFTNIFGKNVGSIFSIMIIFVISISLNGYTMVGNALIYNDADEKLIFSFRKKVALKWSGLFQVSIALMWLLILFVIGTSVNNGAHSVDNKTEYYPIFYAEIFSNIISIFSFLVYSLLLVSLVFNRIFNKNNLSKSNKVTPYFATISAIVFLTFIIFKLYLVISKLDITTFILFGIIIFSILIYFLNEYLLKSKWNFPKPATQIITNKW